MIVLRSIRTSAASVKHCLKLKSSFSVLKLSKKFIHSKMDEKTIIHLSKLLAPPLTYDRHKGQAGRIGVFGGSLEYTGAPYFAAISSLKVGADLSHVFCSRDAAPVIKSYSPELIVHPLLDDKQAALKIEPWLDRLHVILIGPGLGREPSTFKVIDEVVELCRARKKPLVWDADGLYYVSLKPEILCDYPAPIILTPNVMEFARLIGSNDGDSNNKADQSKKLFEISPNLTIFCKGHIDEIFNSRNTIAISCGGSGRRCGGQGDLLSGSVSTFLAWALEQGRPSGSALDNRPLIAAYAAGKLVRLCNEKAFRKHGRSMTCTDMIQEIHEAFEELYEIK